MATSNIDMSAFAYDPLVTIAIPTFNGASWLRGCLFSALAQTYPHFEVLISDNASTDDTQQVLKEINDPRVRVVKQERNIGLIPNWNACLAEAKGDFFVLVPVDDRIQPWLLERCVALVRQEPQIPIVIALCDLHSTLQARTWPATVNRKFVTGIWDGDDILVEFLNGRISAQMSSIMLRTEVFRARGGYPKDFTYAGDKAGWAPLLLVGKAGFINESSATFNMHTMSQSAKSVITDCVNDECKFGDLIISMTKGNGSLEGSRKRRMVKLACNHYSARRTIQLLSAHRKNGVQLIDVVPILWQSRRHLIHIGLGNLIKLGRPLAVLFLPGPVANWVVSLLRPIYQYALNWRS